MNKPTYESIYLRNYREKNPEKVQQWQLNTAQNRLTKAGYTVKAPAKPKKKPVEEMTDDELRETLEEKRRRNREACYKWRKGHKEQFLFYQREYGKQYRQKQREEKKQIEEEINRRHIGE